MAHSYVDEHYNFAANDRDRLRDTLLRANRNYHFVMEKLFPSALPQEVPAEALREAGEIFFDLKNDIVPLECNKRMRVSFEGAKKTRLPDIGVFLTAANLENLTQYHRIPLVIVSGYPSFVKNYGDSGTWSPEDPRLKDALLGGTCNVGWVFGEHCTRMIESLLSNWILCGPMFDVFWKSKSFDIHYDERLDRFINMMTGSLKPRWQRNMDFYAANEEKLRDIRSKSGQWRKTSGVCLSIGCEDDFVLKNMVQSLVTSGYVDRAENFEQINVRDSIKQAKDAPAERFVDAGSMLDTVINLQPAFAVSPGTDGSPFGLYSNKVSPQFIFNRMALPFWGISMPNQPYNSKVCCTDMLSMVSAGNYSIFEINKGEHSAGGSSDSLKMDFLSLSLPDVLMNGRRSENVIPFAGKETIGCLYAVKLTGTEELNSEVRKKLFFVLTKSFSSLECNLGLFKAFLKTYRHHMFHEIFAWNKCISFEGMDRWFSGTKLPAGISCTLKLAFLADIEQICGDRDLPFRFHSEGFDTELSTDNWHGLTESEEILKLQGDGWLRISPNRQSWGEPYGDMLENLEGGTLCTGVIHGNPEGERRRIMEGCCFTDAASLGDKIDFAVRDPQGFRDSMEAAFWTPAPGEEGLTEEKRAVFDLFRRSPCEPIMDEPEVRQASWSTYPQWLLDMLREPKTLHDFVMDTDIDQFVEDMVASGVKRRFMELHRAYWGL